MGRARPRPPRPWSRPARAARTCGRRGSALRACPAGRGGSRPGAGRLGRWGPGRRAGPSQLHGLSFCSGVAGAHFFFFFFFPFC